VRRIAIRPRPDLETRAAELGFTFFAQDGAPYWDESHYYAFTLGEIERDLEAPTLELAQMCVELAGRICRDEDLLEKLAVPRHAWSLVAESWCRGDATLYGRLDFSYDGTQPAKLLEYNADTPTALYEAAVFQWFWLEDMRAGNLLPLEADQFNSLHEKLIARLKAVVPGSDLHLTGMLESEEDKGFIAYLEDCAKQAGLVTRCLAIGDIGLDEGVRFVDLGGRTIDHLFKLYPWEWIYKDRFGTSSAMERTRFIEPPWKAILSSKGILPLLWEMAPGHPNLLPAYFESDPRKAELGTRFVRKPLYSREGANVMIVEGDKVVAREGGSYGAEGYIRQAVASLPDFGGRFPVVGSWIVGAEAAGIGIREDATPITRDCARFVPHAIIG